MYLLYIVFGTGSALKQALSAMVQPDISASVYIYVFILTHYLNNVYKTFSKAYHAFTIMGTVLDSDRTSSPASFYIEGLHEYKIAGSTGATGKPVQPLLYITCMLSRQQHIITTGIYLVSLYLAVC